MQQILLFVQIIWDRRQVQLLFKRESQSHSSARLKKAQNEYFLAQSATSRWRKILAAILIIILKFQRFQIWFKTKKILSSSVKWKTVSNTAQQLGGIVPPTLQSDITPTLFYISLHFLLSFFLLTLLSIVPPTLQSDIAPSSTLLHRSYNFLSLSLSLSPDLF